MTQDQPRRRLSTQQPGLARIQAAIARLWFEVSAAVPCSAARKAPSTNTRTITSRGQITIPKRIRDELGLGPGARVSFLMNAEGFYELHSESRPVELLAGSLHFSGRVLSVADMEAEITRAARGDACRDHAR